MTLSQTTQVHLREVRYLYHSVLQRLDGASGIGSCESMRISGNVFGIGSGLSSAGQSA